MKYRTMVVLLLGIWPGLCLGQLPPPTPAPVPAPGSAPAPLTTPATPPQPLVLPGAQPILAPTLLPAAPLGVTAPPVSTASAALPTCLFSAEYLYWWFKVPSVPPLLTTSRHEKDGGILGRPTTELLAGGTSEQFDNLNGVRGQLRYNLDELYGLDVSGFYLANGGRYPTYMRQMLAVPYIDPISQEATALQLSNFVGATGYAAVQTYAQLASIEANGMLLVSRDPELPVDLLVGGRYMQLFDDFRFWTYTENNASIQVAGQPAPLGTKYAGFDQFQTRNQFYGGQIALRGRRYSGRYSIEATASLAVGVTHQELDMVGQTNVNVPPSDILVGNVFVEKTNLGKYSRDVFAVIPQAQIKVGYQVFDFLRLSAGFDMLYWNDVVRPTNQIDTVINPALIPMLNGDGQGVRLPQPRFLSSDFWALGISLGMELAF